MTDRPALSQPLETGRWLESQDSGEPNPEPLGAARVQFMPTGH
jgi:hypothetical protein